MKKQIKIYEIFFLAFAQIFCGVGYSVIANLFLRFLAASGINDNAAQWFVYYIGVVLVPAFAAVFISGILQTARYRIINATIFIFVLLGLQAGAVLRMSNDLVGVLYSSLQVSLTLIAGLIALRLLKKVQSNHMRRNTEKISENSVLLEQPSLSLFLKILAIVSVPFVFIVLILSAVITMSLSAWLLLLLFQLPRAPIILLIAGGLAPLAALYGSFIALKNILKPFPMRVVGVELSEDNANEITAIINDVAEKLKTRKPDYVVLNAQPGFFVTQGKVLVEGRALNGRILSIGLPDLMKMNEAEFRAVLAHEYAHFTGNDTSYSLFVAPVYRGIISSISAMQNTSDTGGSVGAIISILQIPAMLYLLSFYEYFSVIDNMLSRNRELRADWISVQQWGNKALASALEKTSLVSMLYVPSLKELELSSEEKFFSFLSENIDIRSEDAVSIKKELYGYRETEFDSHPSLKTRTECMPDVSVNSSFDRELNISELGVSITELSKLVVATFRIPVVDSADVIQSEE